nr:hypothetical protein [Rickettsia endosymbiont of Ceutorhynchus assimilis]
MRRYCMATGIVIASICAERGNSGKNSHPEFISGSFARDAETSSA